MCCLHRKRPPVPRGIFNLPLYEPAPGGLAALSETVKKALFSQTRIQGCPRNCETLKCIKVCFFFLEKTCPFCNFVVEIKQTVVYISHEVNTSFYKKTSEYISQQNHVHPNLALSKIKACMSPTPCFPNNSSLKESFVLNILPSSELSLMVSFLWLFKSDLLFDPYMFLFSAFLLSVYFLSHSFVQDVCISHLRQLPGAQL